MPRSYQAGKFGRAADDGAIAVQGFAALQRVLRNIEGGAQPELRKRIRAIGDHVAIQARGHITHRTGRHGTGGPRLADSIKVSVTQRSASVYSTALHGGVQNVGGKVGRGGHTLLKRADVSAYMRKGVQDSNAFVEEEVTALLAWLETTFMEK